METWQIVLLGIMAAYTPSLVALAFALHGISDDEDAS